VERARKAHRGDDAAEIKAAMDELSAAYQEAGRSLYSQTQAEPGPAPGSDGAAPGAEAPAGEAKPEDVVEADYEIVDDKK
jgi:molecular chaperone DnaK